MTEGYNRYFVKCCQGALLSYLIVCLVTIDWTILLLRYCILLFYELHPQMIPFFIYSERYFSCLDVLTQISSVFVRKCRKREVNDSIDDWRLLDKNRLFVWLCYQSESMPSLNYTHLLCSSAELATSDSSFDLYMPASCPLASSLLDFRWLWNFFSTVVQTLTTWYCVQFVAAQISPGDRGRKLDPEIWRGHDGETGERLTTRSGIEVMVMMSLLRLSTFTCGMWQPGHFYRYLDRLLTPLDDNFTSDRWNTKKKKKKKNWEEQTLRVCYSQFFFF